jgi:hypothetical protein
LGALPERTELCSVLLFLFFEGWAFGGGLYKTKKAQKVPETGLCAYISRLPASYSNSKIWSVHASNILAPFHIVSHNRIPKWNISGFKGLQIETDLSIL